MCFLDAKKTFVGVNHWILAEKLVDRNVLLHIVNCLSNGIESKCLFYDGVTYYQ